MEPVKVCYASSELAPFAKTGGLADASAGLVRYLKRAGHDVRVFLPFYSRIDGELYPASTVEFVQQVPIHMGRRTYVFSLAAVALPDSDLSVYLVHCPELFDRKGIYSEGDDEALRFAFFCRAVIESCQRMGWGPDVFHLNDWHTSLLPLYLKTAYGWDPLFANSRTILSIHNISYQGQYGEQVLEAIDLEAQRALFYQEDLARGMVNFMKTGLLYADGLTTVSPTYAREIQTPEFGGGLEGFLRERSNRLVGVLNGVDYSEWSPENDRYIPTQYSATDLAGKAKNKADLLETLGLDTEIDGPLLGVVSRLTYQKGFDLLFEVLPQFLAARGLRVVALGTGEEKYEKFFTDLQHAFPRRVCYHRGYNEELAHRIEAAADLFAMPSRFEPCGLNQMYSLRYGTPPIVRKTGGLADSVQLFDRETKEGTGFVFDHFTPEGFAWALDYAFSIFYDREAWAKLQQNGMALDYSWDVQGEKYVDLYRHLQRS